MRVIRHAQQMSRVGRGLRRDRVSVGFVPTMGALHDGHLSLIREARREARVVVVSIFVNPRQFGPAEDYARYPRTLARDLKVARAAGADIVFVPTVRAIYPDGFCTAVEVAGLSDQLEGASRPGHFRGVATVVLVLLNLVRPTVLYLGQKDYQQAVILSWLVKGLHHPIRVRVKPTIREPDGLAMSSRNRYLPRGVRPQAAVIYEALREARGRIRAGERNAHRLIQAMRRRIGRVRAARIEYLAIGTAESLQPISTLRGRVAILAAVRIGSTRLIDNILVDVR